MIYFYIAFRLYFLFFSGFDWTFTVMAGVFFLAELFILVQALGYLRYIETVARNIVKKESEPSPQFNLKEYPPVAIVVASYKEPLKVIEETLLCLTNLFYPNKHLYLLDDTRYDIPWKDEVAQGKYANSVERLCKWLNVNLFRRKWHHAKAGIINDFMNFRSGDQNSDYKMIYNDGKSQTEKEKYLIVFDADMNPVPDFVEPLVRMMESDPTIAFVQTPQYYTNFSTNRVARAASLMQVIFYEYICEAKGIDRIMLLCGTNVIIRMKAMEDVGGFDCSSVTEDFATALNMHQKGWSSLYLNNVCAFGMGPEDLGSLFKQQFRWALGTVGLLPKILKEFFLHPLKHPIKMMVEYILSSSYYIIGWIYLILMLGPSLYLFFDIPIYIFPPVVYFALVIPYNIAINFLFFWSHSRRGYSISDLFSGVILGILSMPVYMKASAYALLGVKGTFVVTPKDECKSLPLSDLWGQVTLAMISFSTIIYGLLRLYFEGEPFVGIIVNIFWSFYYFAIFCSVFYFNNPKEIQKSPIEVHP